MEEECSTAQWMPTIIPLQRMKVNLLRGIDSDHHSVWNGQIMVGISPKLHWFLYYFIENIDMLNLPINCVFVPFVNICNTARYWSHYVGCMSRVKIRVSHGGCVIQLRYARLAVSLWIVHGWPGCSRLVHWCRFHAAVMGQTIIVLWKKKKI